MRAADLHPSGNDGSYKLVIGSVMKVWIGIMTILGAAMFTGMITLYARVAVVEERLNSAANRLEKQLESAVSARSELLTTREFQAEMGTIREELSHLRECIIALENAQNYRLGRAGGNSR